MDQLDRLVEDVLTGMALLPLLLMIAIIAIWVCDSIDREKP